MSTSRLDQTTITVINPVISMHLQTLLAMQVQGTKRGLQVNNPDEVGATSMGDNSGMLWMFEENFVELSEKKKKKNNQNQ